MERVEHHKYEVQGQTRFTYEAGLKTLFAACHKPVPSEMANLLHRLENLEFKGRVNSPARSASEVSSVSVPQSSDPPESPVVMCPQCETPLRMKVVKHNPIPFSSGLVDVTFLCETCGATTTRVVRPA